MKVSKPEPGLVINYSYLWHHERMAGASEGRKDRPVVLLLTIERLGDSGPEVIVLPITHRRPSSPDAGVPIPQTVKRHLGLDDGPSWIIVEEGNEFIWPGYDLRRRSNGEWTFGFLPPRFFNHVRKAFIALYRQRRARISHRD